MNMKPFCMLAALIALAGCTMIPEHTKPVKTTSDAWPEVPGYTTQAGSMAAAELAWQQFFDAPDLHQMIELGLANNKDLRLAGLNIQEARALYRIERAALYPEVVGTGSATINRSTDESSSSGEATRSELYSVNAGVAQYELDFFGKIQSRNQAAINTYLATEEAAKVVQIALVAEIANAYLQLLADRELLALTENTLSTQEETVKLVTALLERGLGTDQNVARANTALETARIDQHRFKRFVAQDINALVLLLGIRQDEFSIPTASLQDFSLATQIAPALPSEVLLARPDIRQREYELLASNANIGAARAAFYPSIKLTGSFGFASDSFSGLFDSGAFGAWSFMPQVTVPIFNSGRLKANLNVAEIRKEKAVLAYEQTLQIAFREVADALAAKATLDLQLQAHDRQVAAAKKAYELAEARFKAGIDSFLAVLDAQRDLYQFQQSRILTQQVLWSNYVQLYKALGGGVLEQ